MAHRTTVLLLSPTVGQTGALERMLGLHCELYNAALEERRGAWRWESRSVKRLEQYAELNDFDHPVLEFGVTPARGTLLRLDRAFCGFFRRVKKGEKPGFPRFRSRRRFDSVEYPQPVSWKLSETASGKGRLYLQGIGHVRFHCSKRGVLGTPKTLVVRREGRRWRGYVVGEGDFRRPLPVTGRQVGLDLGVRHLAATSDGELVENERFTRRSLEQLASAQQVVERRRRGSARRRQAARRVGELQRRVARQRRDQLHKLSRRLVEDYDLLVAEDLKIANMTRRPRPRPGPGGFLPNGAAAKAGLNREILSSGWGILISMLTYKAEEAGRRLVLVDPRLSSQRCASCGHSSAE
ncbi:MAG TPA: transposase, partial [Acidimicrobiales bacterium]|nr:transposase [Acidimicrobiales bacterium]